jgi:hypothetical protein
MTSTPLALRTICDERRLQQLANVPASRFEMVSPYETTTYTKFDLDMRRKAQILKYNTLNIQVNNLSNKQKWSQLVKGNAAKVSPFNPNVFLGGDIVPKYTPDVILDLEKNKIVACLPSGALIRTNPSACGVPPDPNVPFLYDDERVPLYNYVNPISTRSYGILNPDI